MSVINLRPRAPLAPRNPVVPENPAQEGGALLGFPPWHFKPRGAPTVQQAAGALINPGASAVLLSVDPGVGYSLRVVGIGFGANDPTALTNATFTLTQNGNPIQGWGTVAVSIGSLDRPYDPIIVISGPGALVLTVTNNFAGMAWTYFARLVGWTFIMGTAAGAA